MEQEQKEEKVQLLSTVLTTLPAQNTAEEEPAYESEQPEYEDEEERYSDQDEQVTRLPGIVSDIDGVILLGKNPIGDSAKTVDMIFGATPDKKVPPFMFLTNGGGEALE